LQQKNKKMCLCAFVLSTCSKRLVLFVAAEQVTNMLQFLDMVFACCFYAFAVCNLKACSTNNLPEVSKQK